MNWYAPLLVAIITTTVHVSTALDTKSVFGTCPQFSNLEDKPEVGGKLVHAQDYQIWHDEQCNAANSITQNLQSMPLLRHADEVFQRLGHRSLRCAAIKGCSNLIPPLLQQLNRETGFRHCKVVVATSVYSARDLLPQTPTTAHPASTCFVAFIDRATAEIHANGSDVNDEGTIRGWQVYFMELPKHINSPRIQSRVLKILLPQLFPLAHWSIWVDAKVHLRHDPWLLLSNILWRNNASFAATAHYARYSFLEEGDRVMELGYMRNETVAKQRRFYLSSGMTSSNTGLIEGMLLIRDHRSVTAPLVSCLWWQQLLAFPPRDQLVFPFVTFQLGFRPNVSNEEFEALKKFRAEVDPRGRARHKQSFSWTYSSVLVNETIHAYPFCTFVKFAELHAHRSEAAHLNSHGTDGF
jgi:hypothetical protein